MLNAVRWLSDLANSGIYVLEGLSMGQPVPVRREPVVVFVGSSPRGPVGIPVKIQSVGEFKQRFGLANDDCTAGAPHFRYLAAGLIRKVRCAMPGPYLMSYRPTAS